MKHVERAPGASVAPVASVAPPMMKDAALERGSPREAKGAEEAIAIYSNLYQFIPIYIKST